MATFKGFNTIGRIRAPYTLTDGALIKRDLLNEFNTRLGERVMRPNFGSIIWDLLMDPSTPELEEQIRQDVLKIIDRDPRVEHLNTTITILDHTIRVEITINMLPYNSEDVLYLNYTRDLTAGAN